MTVLKIAIILMTDPHNEPVRAENQEQITNSTGLANTIIQTTYVPLTTEDALDNTPFIKFQQQIPRMIVEAKQETRYKAQQNTILIVSHHPNSGLFLSCFLIFFLDFFFFFFLFFFALVIFLRTILPFPLGIFFFFSLTSISSKLSPHTSSRSSSILTFTSSMLVGYRFDEDGNFSSSSSSAEISEVGEYASDSSYLSSSSSSSSLSYSESFSSISSSSS